MDILIDNPGNKRCRICGGLITEAKLIRACNHYRHESCIPKHRKVRMREPKRLIKRQRNLRFIKES